MMIKWHPLFMGGHDAASDEAPSLAGLTMGVDYNQGQVQFTRVEAISV